MVQPSGSMEYPLCSDGMEDHIPCLDNQEAIKKLRNTAHYEHRERHCPAAADTWRCMVPLPNGYKVHVPWPQSRDEVREWGGWVGWVGEAQGRREWDGRG